MHEHTAPELVALYSRVATLKLLPRTGWLQRGVALPESIAEHSFGVATLALLVGDGIPGLDRGKLLAIALLHDLAEAVLGDLPASARRLFGAHVKHAAERAALEEVFAQLPDQPEYLALWDEYATASSAEARLVKELDRIEMLMQALIYERAGNRNLGEFWMDADQGWSDEFPIVRALATELLHQRHRVS
ncbi:MAG TPA: HD domain-containing protein [Roseiflexaceae bacterium]|jgi:putative hydrolase of HD superfamily|nr:HD domain-containing protein [Roseiflexaceae bacterium]